MTDSWQTIWSNKSVVTIGNEGDEFQRFCELKRANGFDVAVHDAQAYYTGFYYEWIAFFHKVIDLVGDEIESVFEVGCGSGVDLFMFGNRLSKGVRLGGIDYSPVMIESAKISTHSSDFMVGGADEVAISPKYDLVMADSVFQYFPSMNYAEKVLEIMIRKSEKLTYLGEIHNKECEEELIAYRRKTIKDYDQKYEGLSKLFLSRSWIEAIASRYGKKVLFTDVNNSEYLNARYEFNCYIF